MTTMNERERLKQIRERREAYTRLLVRYEYPDLPNWEDIDFLLSLVDGHVAGGDVRVLNEIRQRVADGYESASSRNVITVAALALISADSAAPVVAHALNPDAFCLACNEHPCKSAASLAAPEGEPAPATCLWTYNPDGYWQTACGDQFCITEGTPAENRMRYCHYCGRQIAAPASEPRVMEDNSMHGNDAVCGSPANNEKPK